MTDLPDLRSVVRREAVPAAATILVLGGPGSVAKLRAHAERTARAFALDGVPALGLSVFAALDDVGAASAAAGAASWRGGCRATGSSTW